MSWIDPSELIPVMCCPLGLIWATGFPICSYDHSQGKLELLQTPFSPLDPKTPISQSKQEKERKEILHRIKGI